MKILSTRYPTKCSCCGKTIPAGETICYDKTASRGKKASCYPLCEAKTLDPTDPTPDPELKEWPCHVHETFTFDGFLSWAETTEPCLAWADRAATNSQAPANEWSGNVDYEGMVDLCQSGWPDGLQAFEAANFNASSSFYLARARWTYGVAGCRPLVPLAIAGAPACMMQYAKRMDGKPVYRILAYLGNNASVDAQLFYHWGLGILALVDGLENGGASVELVGRLVTEKNGCRGCLDIELKMAGQPLDLDRLVTMVAHAGITRRLFFRWLETHPGLYGLGDGYGHCPTRPPLFEAGFDFVLPPLQDFQGRAQTPTHAVNCIAHLYQEHLATTDAA